jgi:hypothetical protein
VAEPDLTDDALERMLPDCLAGVRPSYENTAAIIRELLERRREVERLWELVKVREMLAGIGDFDFTERNRKLGRRCFADTERERLKSRESELLAELLTVLATRPTAAKGG